MSREDNIKELLEKYLEGETQLEEEKILADYFNTNEVKPEWKVYQDMFKYFEVSQTEKTEQTFRPQSQNSIKSWYRYAAVLVLCLAGAWFYNNQYYTDKNLGTYEDPELALQETKKVFELIGSYINTNTDELQNLNTLETTKTKYIDNIHP